MSSRVTIKDVAKAAGVSPATVSLILNNKPVSITQSTRDRVWEKVRELDYHPNQLAISLVTSTSNTVGLLIPDSTNPFMANLVRRIRIKLIKDGITVITGNTDYDAELTKRYLRAFADRRVDAMVITQLDYISRDSEDDCAELIRNMGIPVISYGRDVHNIKSLSSVEVDQVQIGYMATRHLLQLGHRRIGCAASDPRLDVTQLRFEGYCRACREFSLEPDPAMLFGGTFSIESGETALPYLLGQNSTAIFAFNDLIAYGIYKSAKNYHLSIPKDLSVVSVDDLPFSEIIEPPLTTVAQNSDEIADQIVNTVRSYMGGSKEKIHIVVHPVLKVRGSTMAVGGSRLF